MKYSRLIHSLIFFQSNLLMLFLCLCLSLQVLADADNDNAVKVIDTLRQQLAIDPGNSTVEYKLARELSFSGKPDEAIKFYQSLLQQEPENADYLLGIGQSLLWNHQPQQAIPYLEKATKIAPQYEDAYRTLAQAYVGNGQYKDADKIYNYSLKQFNDPQWAKDGLHASGFNDHTEYSLFSINNTLEDPDYLADNWRDTQFSFSHIFAKRKDVSVYYENTERFSIQDHTAGISVTYPLTGKTTLYTELSYSPTHDVVPEYSGWLQLNQALSDGFGVILGIKQRKYSNDRVYTGDFTLEKYISDFRFAYTAYLSDSDAGSSLAHRIQSSYYLNSDITLNLAFSTGTELEKSTIPGVIQKTDFSDIGLWGNYWIEKNLNIKCGFGYTNLDIPGINDPVRKRIELGLDYRF